MTTSKQIYCFKCRSFTDNTDLHIGTIVTKGKDRIMEKAICSVCGKKKNRFIKTLTVIAETAVPDQTSLKDKFDKIK